MARLHVPGILLLLAADLLLGGCTEDPPADDAAPRYLLFQLFTFAPSPDGTATPLDSAQLQGVIDDILATLGDERGDGRDQQLGFSIGPLTLDHTDDEMRAQIERFDGQLRDFVKERPILALLGAVAAGYVVGRVMRRIA